MQTYYGTKRIQAEPQERDGQPGYKVVYSDSYESWSPKDVFEEAYQPITGMSFGHALVALKSGLRVARQGWNGKNQFVYLIKGTDLQDVLKYGYGEYMGEPTIQSALAIKTSAGQIQVGWLASQTDMLADDWIIIGEID